MSTTMPLKEPRPQMESKANLAIARDLSWILSCMHGSAGFLNDLQPLPQQDLPE